MGRLNLVTVDKAIRMLTRFLHDVLLIFLVHHQRRVISLSLFQFIYIFTNVAIKAVAMVHVVVDEFENALQFSYSEC